MTYTWSDILTTLVTRADLDTAAASWAMEEILRGNATPAQIAGFAVGLRAKGETVDEVQGLVDAMYRHATPLSIEGRFVDIVGTGGDRAKTVNISTMASVVMAGAGAPVVKHGNRSASSASGSADVLEQLGVRLDTPADKIAQVFDEAGITFCFAPMFHGSFRFTAVPRRELAIATIFNFLGPLTNPAHAPAMAVGSANLDMAPIMAGIFARRGTDGLVFRGEDGLDEITTTTTSRVWVADGQAGTVTESMIDPQEFGIEFSPIEALRGGDPAFNAAVFERVMAGEHSAVRDAVVLNAGAGLAAFAGGSAPLAERLAAGIEKARESLDSGAAQAALYQWAKSTQSHSPT